MLPKLVIGAILIVVLATAGTVGGVYYFSDHSGDPSCHPASMPDGSSGCCDLADSPQCSQPAAQPDASCAQDDSAPCCKEPARVTTK
ncbi:MAG: hypothetical protein ACJ8F7_07990 [Gemmataceae bacterium]